MPAEQRLFREPAPAIILLDTSYVVAHIVAGEKHHDECLSFSEKLRTNSVVIYSTILRAEYLNAWRSLLRKGYLPAEPSAQIRLEFGILRGETGHWLRIANKLLDQFLSHFYRKEIRLNRRVLRGMLEIMGRHNLRSYDAIHLASAREARCADIASFDDHFRRVDEIVLWSNRRD